jgi:GT2 family glycosyltransferase/glycosyltransferase involved in cell wall biosynthesis
VPVPFRPKPERAGYRSLSAIAHELRRVPTLRQAVAKLQLARRRFGSWQRVWRRLRMYLAAEGLASTLARFRLYGATLPGLEPVGPIEARYAAARADIRDRIAATPPVPPGSADLANGRVISLVMPTYRVSTDLLERTIASVLRQSYPRWELCVVDDGSGDAALADLLRRHAAQEPRIRLHLSATNAGIAAASNQALALATGAYVGFLDHDDLLTHDALYWVAQAIAAEPDIDIIYTDECRIDDLDQAHEIFRKPDWSPALLFNSMYIGHLSVYRRALIAELGGLRSRFDYSQDYDLALRATEGAVKVGHVERVLYCWRMTRGSAAVGDKPFARVSNIAALQDALDRRGYPAEAEALPAANHARWRRTALSGKVSIVIPSDHAGRILESIGSIREATSWENYEILVVTRTAIANALATKPEASGVRFVGYDAAFNFSAKCNAGAAAASGEYVIFYNDDVRVRTPDWIELLLECLQIEGVGAVAPKLLYENGTIQHAGLVIGVRRLIGTALHCLPGDTKAYFNLAQSLREVSSLSGACLAVRLDVFHAFDGFDAVNTPISHSDVDLCFKLRAGGYRCLYTPHATLLHVGHLSLGEQDMEAPPARKRKDKADIHLLRRWPDYVAHDPFYPPAMKALLYADSPQDFDIYPAASADQAASRGGGRDVLILSHDLTNSGAPRIVFDMATALREAGHFVIVMSPTDGCLRHELAAAGITVLVEPLLLAQHDSLRDFARNFDRVIANTVVSWPAVLQLSRVADVYWYIHESQLIADEFDYRPDFVQALHEARQVWAISKRTQRYLQKRRADVALLETSVDAFPAAQRGDAAPGPAGRALSFAVIGSYEPRKGQDVAIAAIGLLPEDIRRRCRFNFFGRTLDEDFRRALPGLVGGMSEIHLGPDLSHELCLQQMQAADVILCPSRDDAMSLVALEAMSLGKVVACTAQTGISEYLRDMESGIVIADPRPETISAALLRCIEAHADWPRIAQAGHEIYSHHFTRAAFAKRLRHQLAL